MCNFALPDMVGHTGVYDAAIKAITAADKGVGTIYDACEKAGYVLMITADHDSAEQMINLETGAPYTAHTTNKVPFILTRRDTSSSRTMRRARTGPNLVPFAMLHRLRRQ